MDFNPLKKMIFSGSLARRVLLRAFMLSAALSIVPLLQMISEADPEMFYTLSTPADCASKDDYSGQYIFAGSYLFWRVWGSFGSIHCVENGNLTTTIVRELMGKQMLSYSSKALCVGEGSMSAVTTLRNLGFSDVNGVHRHSFFSLKHKKFAYELDYEDNSYDFVFSRDLDKVSVPALLVLEIERVLKPGGIGAVLVGISVSDPGSLIRSATPVSSLLKASTVEHVDYVNEFTLVVFKKKPENTTYFEQFRLPANCPAMSKNKDILVHMEPLVEKKPLWFETSIAYLPKFVNVSSKQHLIYIDIGAAQHLNSNGTNWFLPSYPVDHKAFDIYFVDHNTSVMLSYVKKPGVNFIYHPGLAGNRGVQVISGNKDSKDYDIIDDLDPFVEDEEFDFLLWFKNTVQYADFLVLKMNVGPVELKFLSDLFESGMICFVDELFLHCSQGIDSGVVKGDCMDLFKTLRRTGVYVHQWWGN